MKKLSVKLEDEVIKEADKIASALKLTTNRYINEAISMYNVFNRKHILKRRFVKESKEMDLFIKSDPLTEDARKEISTYIKQYKQTAKKKKKSDVNVVKVKKKRNTHELDVDFIQSRPLTKKEEAAISAYIKKSKEDALKTKKIMPSSLI